MTAGVQQSIEPSAYLSSSSLSSSSLSSSGASSPEDAKKAGAADSANTDPQGEPQDFQTELKLQEADAKQPITSSRSETGRSRADSKPDSKKDTQSDDLNLVATVPVPVADPLKPVQPVEPDLSIPAEGAPCEPTNPTQHPAPPAAEPAQTREAKPSDLADSLPQPAGPAQTAQPPSQTQPVAVAPSSPAPSNVTPTDSPKNQQPTTSRADEDRAPVTLPAPLPSRRSARSQQSPKDSPAKEVTEMAAADTQAAPDASSVLIPASIAAEEAPVQSANPQPSAKQTPPAENQPAPPRIDLSLPAPPPEPATSAIQQAADPAPTRAAALAFAARMSALPQKPGDSTAENATSPRVVSNMPLVRIPIRYAPAAQIIQSAEDSDPEIDRTLRVPETRTDLTFSRLETAHQNASVSDAAPAPETVPTARAERVIELPADAPTSAHDIRVRVPDNNGGATQVRFVESGGEVKVSVRADDPTLAQSLRTHLNDLTQRLADGGIPAEIWKPGSGPASSESSQQNPDREGRGSDGRQSGGNGGQQQHQGDRRPAWLEEMEASLDAQA